MNQPITNLNEVQAEKEYYYPDHGFIGRGPYFAFSDKEDVDEAMKIMNEAVKDVAAIVEKLRKARRVEEG